MSNEISKAIRQMVFEMEGEILNLTLEDSLKVSKQISEGVEKIYYDFFHRLVEILESLEFDEDENFSPKGDSPLSLVNWAPLSEYWREVKSFYSTQGRKKGEALSGSLPFYHGITKFRKRQPFTSYVQTLANSSNSVNRFFGPSRVEFSVSKDGRKLTTVSSRGKVRLKRKGPPGGEDVFTKGEGRKVYITSATVRVFPKLIDVIGRGRFSLTTEWKVVDAMIKAGGSTRVYKQLVKINGTVGRDAAGRKTKRPIRPLITPLISWEIRRMQKLVDRNL